MCKGCTTALIQINTVLSGGQINRNVLVFYICDIHEMAPPYLVATTAHVPRPRLSSEVYDYHVVIAVVC